MASWLAEAQEENKQECEIWGIDRARSKLYGMPERNTPALLLSGYFDPVTPPEYGEITLPSFSLGQHVVDPIGSHGIAFSDDCTEDIVKQFLDHPDQVVDTACLSKPSRREEIVPSNAFPSPFIEAFSQSDISGPLFILPILMFLLMFIGGILTYFRYLWKSARKTLPDFPDHVKRLKLRFALASWIFTLAFIGFTICLFTIIFQTQDTPTYVNSLALPGGMRIAFVIPPLLIPVLIAKISSLPVLWKHHRSILIRFSYLVEVLFSLGVIAGLWHLNMLVPWLRFPF